MNAMNAVPHLALQRTLLLCAALTLAACAGRPAREVDGKGYCANCDAPRVAHRHYGYDPFFWGYDPYYYDGYYGYYDPWNTYPYYRSPPYVIVRPAPGPAPRPPPAQPPPRKPPAAPRPPPRDPGPVPNQSREPRKPYNPGPRNPRRPRPQEQ